MTRSAEPTGDDATARSVVRRVSSRPTRRVESPNASSQVDGHPRADSGRDKRSRSGAVPAAARVGARHLARIQAGLLPRDHALLGSLAQLRLASGRQLQALHFGASPAAARSARRTLIRLTEAQVLARLDRRVGGARAGSDGYVYAVGPVGERLLQRDRTEPPRRRRRAGEVSDGFADHTLDIAEVFVRLQRARAQGHLEDLLVQTEPRCWRQMSSADGEEEEWLKPDLLVAATTRTNEHHSFVEVDRGTEHSPAILRKVRAYELAYRLGVTAVSREVFPRVVWLTPDARRTEFLSDLLLRDSRATPELHLVAPLTDALAVLTGGEVSDERVVAAPNGEAS